MFDDLPPDVIVKASGGIRRLLPAEMPHFYDLVESGGMLDDADREALIVMARKAVDAEWKPSKP